MSSLKEIQRYTPPVLHTGKDWYIDFYDWATPWAELSWAFSPNKFIPFISDLNIYSNRIDLRKTVWFIISF